VPSLQFRLPGRADKLGSWLAALLPEVDRVTRRRWIEEARVRVERRLVDRLSVDCPPGAWVEIADIGPECLSATRSDRHSRWIALVDSPAWRSGSIWIDADRVLDFEVDSERDGLAILRITGPACEPETVRQAFAAAEMPLVGDLVGGGLGVAGGIRLVPIDLEDEGDIQASSALDWPSEPAWITPDAEDHADSSSLTLCVSDETARAIEKGHPWVLPDDASDSAARFRPGTLLQLVSRTEAPLGWARVEADRRLAARLWATREPASAKGRSRHSGADKTIASIESRVARALAIRRDLLVDLQTSGTNAFRLIHAEADGLPGLFVDRLGPLLRVLVTGRACDLVRERIIAALLSQLPLTPEGEPWSVLELLHLRSAGPSRFDRVRWVSGGLDALAECDLAMRDDGFEVFERGLRFFVDPGWATPRSVRPGYGLFVDQRENRARLDSHAEQGGAWLNLFAHTGAFTASLLAAGAEHVTSVDLSAAYLSRLEANLALNAECGVDPSRNESVRGDGRRFLESLRTDQRFAGIVLDPPTAAAAGRRFWSLQQDLEPILRRCVSALDDGGVLLVTQNRSGPPLGLDRVLERIAHRAHRPIARLVPAPAGSDHPTLSGFPEGDPFEGWLMELE
jgi:23S rRNA (cytosine1962-C5)-methyltransferase